jgi:PAS domain S-box-containing protein
MRERRQQTAAPSSAPVSSGVRASSPIDLDTVASVLATAEVGVWQFHAAGARLLASSTALSILGLEDGERFDMSEDALERVHPGDRERFTGELARSRSEPGAFAVEMRVITSSGETRWMDVHGISVHDAKGFSHACGTVQNVTARKEQELFRELLLVTLGHDLRNPLTAIQIGAGLLLRRGRLAASDASTAQRVLASAGRISAMVEQLLDFTRIRVSGTPQCVRRPGNLGVLAAKAVAEIETEYPTRIIELASEGDLDGSWDVDRLGQMVRHLAANAIAHGDTASPVTVRIAGLGDAVELSVHHFGRPIHADEMEGLFHPFRLATQASTQSGLDLGLFVVHEIARAHGGTMHVESSAEEGTLFSVRLPRHDGSTR